MKENIKRMPTDRGRTDSDTVSKEAKAVVPPSDAGGSPDRNEACPPVSKVASVGEETGGRDTAACEETDHAQDKEQRKRELREKAKKVFRFLTNPRLLLCIAIAWMINKPPIAKFLLHPVVWIPAINESTNAVQGRLVFMPVRPSNNAQ